MFVLKLSGIQTLFLHTSGYNSTFIDLTLICKTLYASMSVCTIDKNIIGALILLKNYGAFKLSISTILR